MKFKKTAKRGASFFLALVMCVSLLQVPAYAAEVPETADPVVEAAEPAAEPAPAPAPEVTPEPEPAPPAADVNQEPAPEANPESAPEVPPVQEEPEDEVSEVPPVVDGNTSQESDSTAAPDEEEETNAPVDSETPDDMDDISPEAQAFLDAVKALDDATNAGADFDTLFPLAEACQDAFDALSDADLDREDVASAVVQFAGLMPEAPATLNEEEAAPPVSTKEVKDLTELNSALTDASVDVIKLIDDIVGNITIGRSLTLDLGGFTLKGTGNGSVVTTKNNGNEEVDEVNVTIQNGTITGGKAGKGGGVFVGKDTTVTLTDTGEISGNIAEYEMNGLDNSKAPGNGGGVFISNGGSFILDGGTIKNNETIGYKYASDRFRCGGGIYADAGSSFTMNSGSITGNVAARKGGGICLGSDKMGTVTSVIKSGLIEGNTANTGGGIYVSQGNTLTLKRVAVTENQANEDNYYGSGGGVWFCRLGTGLFNATNGAYISGNTAAKQGDDFTTQLGQKVLSFPTRLYDGTKVEWYLDGIQGNWGGPRFSTKENPEEITNWGDLVKSWCTDNLWGDDLSLHSETLGNSNDSYYNIRITGNTANVEGGGIACNGTLIMGEDKDISLKVNKVWNLEEGTALPDSITVNVLNNGKVIDTVTLNAGNGWSATIDGLPSDGTNYTLQEVSSDGYDVSYGEIVKGEDGTWSLSVTNSTPKPKTTSLTVNKVWDVEAGTTLPESITASVFNGEALVDTVTLNAGNGWKTTLDGLPIDGTYTVSEAAVSGYDSDVTGGKAEDGTWSFTITNTPVVPKTTSLTINKVWKVEEGTALPESITASVFNGEKLVTNVTLNAENEWKATINDLPIDGKYSVSEVTVPGYTASIGGGQTENGTWSFTITNTPNIVVPETTTLTVNKVWSDGADVHVDGSVIVNVLDAMNAIFKTVTLNAANNWTATVDGLSVDVKYTVQEVAVNGYTPSYTENEDGSITITNTLIPTTPERPDRPSRPDRPTTPPTTEIPEPDVPLAPGPEPEEPPVIIEEPDVPLAELPPEVEIPEVEIPEPEVPLAGQPPVTTTIPEPEVPLSDVPMTGDASGLWYAVLGLAACGLVVLNLRKKEEL